MKNKKPLWITIISLDVIVTVFLFVVHIVMLINLTKVKDPKDLTGFCGTLANNKYLYLFGFVVPLFIILAANIIGIVVYLKKVETKKESAKLELNDLSEEEKEALKKELLKDIMGGQDNKE